MLTSQYAFLFTVDICMCSEAIVEIFHAINFGCPQKTTYDLHGDRVQRTACWKNRLTSAPFPHRLRLQATRVMFSQNPKFFVARGFFYRPGLAFSLNIVNPPDP